MYEAYYIFFLRVQVIGFLVNESSKIFISFPLNNDATKNSEKIPEDAPMYHPSSLKFVDDFIRLLLSNKLLIRKTYFGP